MSEFAVRSLLETRTVRVRDICCQGSCRQPSGEESVNATELVFPYRGVYVRHLATDEAVAEANQVLFFNAGETYRVSHLPSSIVSIGAAGDNGTGYGLGVSVVIDPAKEGMLDSAGQFGWGGAASTKVFIDPKESMVVVVLTQYMPFDASFLSLAQTLAYQAIAD